MQSGLREDYSVDFSSAAATSMHHPLNPIDIANKIQAEVIQWNFECKRSGGRGASSQWMKQLKDEFTVLMRFQNPRASWRQNLQTAANHTIDKLCPNRQSDDKQRTICNLILKEVHRTNKSPCSDWLNAKAYAWLKWLSQRPQKPMWYPVHAIAVAHHLFLSEISILSSFVKRLATKPLPEIQVMLRAHVPNVAAPPGSKAMAHNGNCYCLHIFCHSNRIDSLIVECT